MHEYLYHEEYKYLFFKLLSKRRLPLGKLYHFEYDQLCISGLKFHKIRFRRTDNQEFEFFPVIEVFFSISEENGYSTVSEWYSVPGRYRIGESAWLFQNIEIYDYRQAPESNMTDFLIPILKNYDHEAIAILKKYQPETLKKPCRTDAETLAESMRYHIRYVKLSDDHSIEGKVIFSQASVKIYSRNGTAQYEEIQDNTILIDRNACKHNGTSLSTAIVHECVHIYEHRLFFDFQQQYNMLIDKCDNLSLEDIFTESRSSDYVKIMEKQAERITPRILMPYHTVKIAIETFMYGGCFESNFQQMEYVIRKLADAFGVSLEMAKNRMVELGYTEAKGVFNYVNGQYIPSYFADKKLGYNKSYSIPIEKLVTEIQRNQNLEKMLQTGEFIYVEGHICLRNDKFIRIINKKPQLSSYARNHMSECCLVFTIRHSNSDYHYVPNILNKEKGDEEFLHSAAFYSNLRRSADEDRKEERAIPDGFYDAFMFFKNKSKMTYLDISLETHIEKSRLERITSKKEEIRLEPTYNEIVALAVTICPSADLALSFIEASGQGTDKTAKQKYVRNLIFILIGSGIDEFNFAMKSGNYEPFTQEITEKRTQKNVCCS